MKTCVAGCVLALAISACGNGESAAVGETGSSGASPRTPATTPTRPDDWVNVKFTVNRRDPHHEGHVALGDLTIVPKDGAFEVQTVKGIEDWPANFNNVPLKFEANEGEYCASHMMAALLRSTKMSRFVSEPIVLHEEGASGHSKHKIAICPVAPDATCPDKREILIWTEAAGGAHEGISHGEN